MAERNLWFLFGVPVDPISTGATDALKNDERSPTLEPRTFRHIAHDSEFRLSYGVRFFWYQVVRMAALAGKQSDGTAAMHPQNLPKAAGRSANLELQQRAHKRPLSSIFGPPICLAFTRPSGMLTSNA